VTATLSLPCYAGGGAPFQPGAVGRAAPGGTRMLTIILIVLVVLLLFGGGGFYVRGRR
jgi:hypothetical protein